jgi:phosphate transport system permease protein
MSTAVAPAPSPPAAPARTVSRARRVKNRLFTAALYVCGVLALLPLFFIVLFIFVRGLKALNWDFFTKAPTFPGLPGGGISQAFVGTAIIVGIAILISVPLGILSAIYLAEYGKGKLAAVVRFTAEILLSTPSIVAGAVIWSLVVLTLGSFSGFAASLAISVIMWPIITRATEEVLRLVREELREGALALGLPRWKMILRIVLPTASAGMFTAVMLAVARGLGETAPVLLTALGNDFFSTNPFQPMDAIPLRVYNYAQSAVVNQPPMAFAGAICLLVIVLALSITARVISSRQQRRVR